MKSVYLLVFFLAFSAKFVYSQKIVGCYWGAWTPISKIDAKICTHAYFSFYVTDYNGQITSLSPDVVSSFLALRSQNPSIKLFASIGGYNAGTDKFSAVAADSTKLANFVKNCVILAEKFDGIDIDWEYPNPSEHVTYVNMLSSLKSALSAKGKLLAIAVAAGNWQIGQSYAIKGVCNSVDLVNLMSYDLQWPYTTTGPNAGYSVVNNAISTWINGECSPSKLVLGLASYGYNFALSSSSSNGVGASASGATAISYREVCKKLALPGWKTVITDQTPYSFNGNEWISYDDLTSIKAKLNIVNSRGLAGAFFWSTDLDDYDNSCKMGTFPLITLVYKELSGSAPAPTQSPPLTKATGTTKAAGTATATAKATTKSSSTINCGSDGFFANPNDCTKYYQCSAGSVYHYTCSAGLGWNQPIATCDWKSNIPGCV